MKLPALVLLLALTGCHHRVNPTGASADHADVFRVICASATNCTGNVPRTSYTASGPAAGGVLVARNGVIMAEGIDYTATATGGVATVTFTQQPVTDGDVIQWRYVDAGGR